MRKLKKEIEVFQNQSYFILAVIYANDIACNECSEMEYILKDFCFKDKTPLKIYSGIKKRLIKYNDIVNDLFFEDNRTFCSEIFLEIDDVIEKQRDKLLQRMTSIIEQKKYPNAPIIAKMYYTDLLFDMSCRFRKDTIIEISNAQAASKVAIPMLEEIKSLYRSLNIDEIYELYKSFVDTIMDIIAIRHNMDESFMITPDEKTTNSEHRLIRLLFSPQTYYKAIDKIKNYEPQD